MSAKQARITLTIGKGSEGPRSTGDLRLIGLSFALYQIWLYTAIYSAPKSFALISGPGFFESLNSDCHALLVYSFLLTSSLLLVLFSICNKKIRPFICSKKCIACSCLSMFIGTALLLFPNTPTQLVTISGILSGCGTSMIIVQFGIIYSSYDFATCVLNAGLAFAIGFIGADAFVNCVPSPMSGILGCAMPILMLIVLLSNRSEEIEESSSGIPLNYVRPYITRLALSMAFLGIVIGALRVVCGDMLLSSNDISLELVLGVGAMASVGILVLAIALSKRAELWDSLLRNVSPIIVIGLAGIAFLAGDGMIFAAFFTTVCLASLVSLTWILLASFARNLNGSYIFIFGLGYGIVQAASALGAMLANVFSEMGIALEGSNANVSEQVIALTTNIGLSDLALLLLIAFSAGYALVPRFRELKEMLSALMLALSKESLREDSVSLEERANVNRPEKEASKLEEQGKVLDSAPMSNEEGRASSSDAKNNDRNIYENHEPGRIVHDDSPKSLNNDIGNSDDSANSTEVVLENSKVNDSLPTFEDLPSETNTDSTSTSAKDPKGSFVRRCDEIADQYLLSTREREVLFLLAKGHNAAFLTDKLCISKSTAKTHINHIYKKLGIHTQQEVLNMVEERHRGPISQTVDREALKEAVGRTKEEGPLDSEPSKLVERISKNIR